MKKRRQVPEFIVKNAKGMYFSGFKRGGNLYWSYNKAEAKPLENEKCLKFFANHYGIYDPMGKVEAVYVS